MNPKIQELKINNFKKKIIDKYSFLKIDSIYYGTEDKFDTDFAKKANNSTEGKKINFSIYNSSTHKYTDVKEVYINAVKRFKEELDLFDLNEKIIFNINFNSEDFRIKCLFYNFKTYIDNIEDLETSIIVYNEKHTKLVSILRMEYLFEVYKWIAYTSEI